MFEARVRVEVGAEPAAQRLEIADDFLLRESLRAVEGHVLDEVRQSALFLLFEDRSGPDDQRQLCPGGRFHVLTDEVSQSVAQSSLNRVRIEGQ